jgi:hypothetical protein
VAVRLREEPLPLLEAEAAFLHGLSQQLASAQGAQCRRLCGGQYNEPAAINAARSRRLIELTAREMIALALHWLLKTQNLIMITIRF